jgi:hypothetical protein
MTFALTCILGDTLFTHSFLELPNSPTPLLGRDILTKFQAILTLHPSSQKLRPINPSSPSSWSLLTIKVPCFHKLLPTPCPYWQHWWTPLYGISKTPLLPHIMSQLSLQRSFYFPKPISISHLSNPPTGSKAYHLRASR